MERGTPRNSKNSKIRGKNFATPTHFKKKRRIGEVVVLDFPSKKILGQEDTMGVEIHIEVATTGAFEENFYSSDRKLRLGLRILIR